MIYHTEANLTKRGRGGQWLWHTCSAIASDPQDPGSNLVIGNLYCCSLLVEKTK